MMTNSPDQMLQTAFAEARQDLDGEVLTARIMSRTRRLILLLLAGTITFAAIVLMGVWLLFGMSLLESAVIISEFLTMELVSLGEGWLALVLMPINTLASLLALTAKAIHLAWKKIVAMSFSA